MTRYQILRLLVGAAGLMSLPAGILAMRPVRVDIEPAVTRAIIGNDSIGLVSTDSVDLILVERDPFRMSRTPAEVPYNPLPPELIPVEAPPPKPQLMVSGIVWGSEPSALIEGLPEVEGARVMKTGDSSGPIRVKRISRTDVILVGMDTTWVLEVRKPW